MKFRYALGAGALCLAGLASAWVAFDPAMRLGVPYARLNAALAEQLPREEMLSGSKVTINKAVLSAAGGGRLTVAVLAELDLSGMAGTVEITTSGLPRYKDRQIFFADPGIEDLEYDFPSMSISSRTSSTGGASALVTYMLPSLTSSALTRLQNTAVETLPQDTWKQRAAAAVLSGIEATDDGLDVVLHPARLLPHMLTSRHAPVALGIIILCGLIIYGFRSTEGSDPQKWRRARQVRKG